MTMRQAGRSPDVEFSISYAALHCAQLLGLVLTRNLVPFKVPFKPKHMYIIASG